MLKHFTAMQLLLGMQDAPGNYPNVTRVTAQDEVGRMTPDPALSIHDGLDLLHDLLTLVDKEVYKAFHAALSGNDPRNVDGVAMTLASFQTAAQLNMALLHGISSAANVNLEFWSDPPHPCSFITREVVSNLLA